MTVLMFQLFLPHIFLLQVWETHLETHLAADRSADKTDLLNSEKTYRDGLLSLLPAPTTCTYTVDGPCSSGFCLRSSLVFTRRRGSFCRALLAPSGGLLSGPLLAAMVRTQRRRGGGRGRGSGRETGAALPVTHSRERSRRRTEFIVINRPDRERHAPQLLSSLGRCLLLHLPHSFRREFAQKSAGSHWVTGCSTHVTLLPASYDDVRDPATLIGS